MLYGDKNNWYACFAYRLFRLYGLHRLPMLDGGRPAWVTNGPPLSTIEPAPADAEPPAADLDPSLRASWRDVADASRPRALRGARASNSAHD